MPDQRPRWAKQSSAGLIVNPTLFVIGIVCRPQPDRDNAMIPVLCSRLGIIFGAFSSTAVMNSRASSSPVSPRSRSCCPRRRLGHAEGLIASKSMATSRAPRLELFEIPAAPARSWRPHFEFFVVGREFAEPLSLVVGLPAAEMNRADDGSRGSPSTASRTAITAHLGGTALQSHFDARHEMLAGVDGGTIRSGPCSTVGSAPAFASLRPGGAARRRTAHRCASRDLDPVRRGSSRGALARGDRRARHRAIMAYWRAQPDSPVKAGARRRGPRSARPGRPPRRCPPAHRRSSPLLQQPRRCQPEPPHLRLQFLYDLGDKRIVPITAAAVQAPATTNADLVRHVRSTDANRRRRPAGAGRA